MSRKKEIPPFILTIFGASGDLARLKIFPALYALAARKALPKESHIVGYARTSMSEAEFRDIFKKSILDSKKSVDAHILKELTEKVNYFSGQYGSAKDFMSYREFLRKKTHGKNLTHIAYFSVPPTIFKDIIENLGENFDPRKEDLRLIIEKPFGEDRHSARDLFHFTAQYFHDSQLYLLDHYLGKTAVQSLLHLRHANSILNYLIKGPNIANLQITAFEDFGVQDRIGYFEKVGTLKDMVQSHLLQVLALMTISIPISESAESLHREKYSILSALKFYPEKENVSLGQYKSYRSLAGVSKKSETNTFAALRLFIDRESWYRVPIYIRTGKMLNKKHTYVVIEFKKFVFQEKNDPPNRLIVELGPEERATMKLFNKIRGNPQNVDITTVNSLGMPPEDDLPEHAELLIDVLQARRVYFLSFPEIIASWRLVDSITDFVNEEKMKPEIYTDGSHGPEGHTALTKQDGFAWYDPLV